MVVCVYDVFVVVVAVFFACNVVVNENAAMFDYHTPKLIRSGC